LRTLINNILKPHQATARTLLSPILYTGSKIAYEQLRHQFVKCYRPGKRHLRKPTWDAESNPEGRWRAFDYEDLMKRDKVNLDIFWLRDKNLEDSDDLPPPTSSPRRSPTTSRPPWNSSRRLRRR
jgi:hypothetical protein